GLPRETKRRLGLFPGFQQRLIGPLRRHRRVRIALVEILNRVERDASALAKNPVQRPENLCANRVRHTDVASLSESCTLKLGIGSSPKHAQTETAPKAFPDYHVARRGL